MLKTIILIFAILFIILVILQQKNAGLGSMAGGDGGDEIEKTRRGSDKVLHQMTIGTAIVFLALCVYYMAIQIA